MSLKDVIFVVALINCSFSGVFSDNILANEPLNETTTFAGDGIRPADYYERLLSRFGYAEPASPSSLKHSSRIFRSSAEGAPEYLIVTSSSLKAAFGPLVLWKRIKGMTVSVISTEEIVSTYSGVDDAERLRNCLIEFYHQGTLFVLLGGDENIIPTRYAFHSNIDTMPALDLLQICDLYYGDVDGNWDADGDGVFGEPTDDQPDLYPELLVGRVLADSPEEVSAYINKLIAYEQNPNQGDYGYLQNALFISADQMRDYQGVGQHELLTQALPGYMTTDKATLIEAPTGEAENPPLPEAFSAISALSSGWGLVTLLVHGVSDGWVIRSNLYNQWPKSYLFTAEGTTASHGFLPEVASNGKPGLVYSIGCSHGGFDMDQQPFPSTNPCVAEWFLQKPNGGAVAFIGYSRWGWVASSWKLEKAFLEYLYQQDNSIAEAQRYSKIQYSYLRDIVYGLNLYGDPELRLWTFLPQQLTVSYSPIQSTGLNDVEVFVSQDSIPEPAVVVTLVVDDSIVAQNVTDAEGRVAFSVNYQLENEYQVFAHKLGFATCRISLTPEIVLDVDGETPLPTSFALHQNHPNPFNPSTLIDFDLKRPSHCRLEIYNILGQQVATVVDGLLTAGQHSFEWQAGNQPTGVYFARLTADDETKIIKMALLK